MSEGSKGSEETTNHAQDWEVVSLTASTYAAALGPKNPEEFQSENESDVNVNENESPAAVIHLIKNNMKVINLPLINCISIGGRKKIEAFTTD